ncbi:2'-5' RNA ligase family protein [Dyadobacter sp. MSC1_007]|jgi:2'-5' RNA ligase|uniref:2'-5' RNA ligase family protein n=1 Tax=Dyadobacter sp. MSC1_007 TaxID=2909264 RepID=UPI00202F35C8|nr:2'-5' RNA ligase family protein [Dyadobacter sp. MSC1_007]
MKAIHFNNNDWSTITNIRNHMFEYLLVFSCDAVTEAAIGSIKQYFKKNYGCQQSANLRPHLTLFNCVIHDYKLDRIIQGFQKVARHTAPFSIELNRFNQYEGGTFYVDLEDKTSQQVLDLVRKLKGETSDHLSRWASGEFKFCTDPHFTVARQMTPAQLQRAVLEWQQRQFKASFKVSEMVLLRRSLIKGSKCQEIVRIPLMGLPGNTFVQGSLF